MTGFVTAMTLVLLTVGQKAHGKCVWPLRVTGQLPSWGFRNKDVCLTAHKGRFPDLSMILRTMLACIFSTPKCKQARKKKEAGVKRVETDIHAQPHVILTLDVTFQSVWPSVVEISCFRPRCWTGGTPYWPTNWSLFWETVRHVKDLH